MWGRNRDASPFLRVAQLPRSCQASGLHISDELNGSL
jgi:hypothetical protein